MGSYDCITTYIAPAKDDGLTDMIHNGQAPDDPKPGAPTTFTFKVLENALSRSLVIDAGNVDDPSWFS